MPNLVLSVYSEKAVVVRPTLDVEDWEVADMIQMGGKYNKYLKGGEGWIFPTFKKKEIERYLNAAKAVVVAEAVVVAKAVVVPKSVLYCVNNEVMGSTVINKINKSDLLKSVKKEIVDQILRDTKYYGWQINAIYNSKGVYPEEPIKFSLLNRHENIDFIYGSPEKVKEWLDSIEIIDDMYGPIRKKYSVYGGKMGVYYHSFYTGD